MSASLPLLNVLTTMDWAGLLKYDPTSPLIFTRFFFWGFFLVVLAVLSVVYKQSALRIGWLTLASLFFYWKTSGIFVGLLSFSIAMDHFIAKASAASPEARRKKLLLALSITVNLLLLCYFKYAHFVVDTINTTFGTTFEAVNYFARVANAAWDAHFIENKVLLPVGISFYTFHCISYQVDVYRGHVQPVRHITDFAFYVSFFPALVAGPIIRASVFLPQMVKEFSLTRAQFGMAVFWILNGLLKKMLIGDYIAVNFIDRVFSDPMRFTGFENLMAAFGYSLQVYADFSGYTDIAIGLSLLLGFTLPANFDSPYKARSTAEFWKRWHISLSTWLRDYLYIPMGGNRGGSLFSWIMTSIVLAVFVLLTGNLMLPFVFLIVGAALAIVARLWPPFRNMITTNINLMLTMLIGGLWHGASWMFVIWGGLNGIGLLIYKGWSRISPWNKSDHWFARFQAIAITFSFITFTRFWFRSPTLENVKLMLGQIGGDFGWHLAGDVLWGFRSVFAMMLLGFVVHWLPTSTKQWYRERFSALPLWAMAVACIVVVGVIYQTLTAEAVPFIYFQF
ncbi:MAG TPA: MBOAT family O-acyltransferase [Flavobacteriales bacterium]|nr:MBOAT family O-acyltransferase [Flavobacteriales bacterium]